jgi:hypothetical protein
MKPIYCGFVGSPATKSQKKALAKAEAELKKEMYDQISIVSGCIGIALYENWGWRKARISEVFNEIENSWNACSADKNISMIEMCEKETGIAIYREGYEGDYLDLKYFQPLTSETMTISQYIYMRIQQKKWVPATILASAFLSLHKLHGFGKERMLRLRDQVDKIRERYQADPKKIEDACYKITGVAITVK